MISLDTAVSSAMSAVGLCVDHLPHRGQAHVATPSCASVAGSALVPEHHPAPHQEQDVIPPMSTEG